MEIDETDIAKGLDAAVDAVRRRLALNGAENSRALVEVAVLSFLTKMAMVKESQGSS